MTTREIEEKEKREAHACVQEGDRLFSPTAVHSSCHGDMERAPRVKSLHRPIVVCLNPLNQTVTTALMSVVYHLCVSCHSPALSVQTGSSMNYCM